MKSEPARREGWTGKIPPALRWPAVLALVAVVLAVALVAFGRERAPQRAPEAAFPAEAPSQEVAEDRCASGAAHDALKKALFAEAAGIRGSDQEAYARLADYAVMRVESAASIGDGAGACRVALTLDLPPGVAAAGGRRSFSGSVDYLVGASGDPARSLMINGAQSIVIPLATLSRTGGRQRAPSDDPLQSDPLAPIGPLPPPVAQPAPEPAQPAIAPSFDCRHARTRGETAVCADPGLATLDRQMAAQYSRAYGAGDERQRALLVQTRDRFLGFRDNCRDDECIANAYRGRMREIADILANRWQPPR